MAEIDLHDYLDCSIDGIEQNGQSECGENASIS